MKESVAKKWVAALRSGKYEQTRGALKDSNGHCCLGVLCSISPWKNTYTRMRDGENLTNRVLPAKIQAWAGISNPNGRYDGFESLASKNDDGASFEDIALLIDKHIKEL